MRHVSLVLGNEPPSKPFGRLLCPLFSQPSSHQPHHSVQALHCSTGNSSIRTRNGVHQISLRRRTNCPQDRKGGQSGTWPIFNFLLCAQNYKTGQKIGCVSCSFKVRLILLLSNVLFPAPPEASLDGKMIGNNPSIHGAADARARGRGRAGRLFLCMWATNTRPLLLLLSVWHCGSVLPDFWAK